MADVNVILNEIRSAAIREVVRGLLETVNGVTDKTIAQQEAIVTFAGYKHVLQGMTLDLLYSKRVQEIVGGAKPIEVLARTAT